MCPASTQWEAVFLFLEDVAARAEPGSEFVQGLRGIATASLQAVRDRNIVAEPLGPPLPTELEMATLEREQWPPGSIREEQLRTQEHFLRAQWVIDRVAAIFPES